jgi:hypothetical protein
MKTNNQKTITFLPVWIVINLNVDASASWEWKADSSTLINIHTPTNDSDDKAKDLFYEKTWAGIERLS